MLSKLNVKFFKHKDFMRYFKYNFIIMIIQFQERPKMKRWLKVSTYINDMIQIAASIESRRL